MKTTAPLLIKLLSIKIRCSLYGLHNVSCVALHIFNFCVLNEFLVVRMVVVVTTHFNHFLIKIPLVTRTHGISKFHSIFCVVHHFAFIIIPMVHLHLTSQSMPSQNSVALQFNSKKNSKIVMNFNWIYMNSMHGTIEFDKQKNSIKKKLSFPRTKILRTMGMVQNWIVSMSTVFSLSIQ